MNKKELTKRVLLFTLLFSLFFSCTNDQPKVLIFSKTAGFRHTSIEAGTEALTKLCQANGMQVVSSEEAAYFTEDSLKEFSAVIFLNTTGDILNHVQQADFERYIQAGGGFVGIHAATDTEYEWPWYNKLVGAYFDNHPKIQDATLKVITPDDDCCSHLGESWTLSEEWYNFKSMNPDVEVLLEIDESSYTGGTNGDSHPMSWKHNYDGGRAFYTALGHKDETYRDSLFEKHILAGINFAIAKKN